MKNVHPLSTSMVVRTLDPEKDQFPPKDDNRQILDPEVPYLNAVSALLYLAQYMRPDILCAVIY